MKNVQVRRVSMKDTDTLIKVEHSLDTYPSLYYAYSPSTDPKYPAEEGWEEVSYYISGRVGAVYNDNTSVEHVYVLSNPAMPGLLKIGFTDRPVSERVRELNTGAGVPVDYDIEYTFPTYNGRQLERKVHRALNEYRVNKKREHFNIDLETAKSEIERIGIRYTEKLH